MNLSVIAGTAPKPPANGGGAPAAAPGSGDGDFSRLLGRAGDSGPQAAGAGTGPSRPAPRDAAQSRADAEAPAASSRETAAKKPAAEAEAPPADAAGDSATGTHVAERAPTQAGEETGATTEGWPPPGLASLLAAPPVPAPPAAMPAVQAPAFPAQPSTLPTLDTPAGHPVGKVASSAVPAPVAGAAGTVTASAPAGPALPAMAAGGEASVPALVLAGAEANAAALPEPSPAATPFALHLAPAPGHGNTAGATAVPLSAPPDAPVPQLQGEGFADDIGTHVQWLAGQKIGHAHIRIAPQELGPVEVRLQLDGDRVRADFTSAQPEVRQALESSLPRLREMLGQQGFELAHAGVGQQSHSPGNGSGQSRTGPGDDVAAAADDTPTPAPRTLRLGLLDAYA